jgi:hypothetical protein
MKNDLGNSIIWPLSLAVFGVASLSTAIILVPSMARKFAEERAALAAPCPKAVVEAAAPAPAPAIAQAQPEPAAQAQPEPAAQAQPEPAVQAADATGPWTISLNPSDYALLGDAEAAIDAISAVLARDPKAKVLLTGVNSPDKSSKRARRGAEVVKEKITADVGVSVRQVETASAQDPAVVGMVVRAALSGGGR